MELADSSALKSSGYGDPKDLNRHDPRVLLLFRDDGIQRSTQPFRDGCDELLWSAARKLEIKAFQLSACFCGCPRGGSGSARAAAKSRLLCERRKRRRGDEQKKQKSRGFHADEESAKFIQRHAPGGENPRTFC